MTNLRDVLEHLTRYGYARDRNVDHEVRTVEITDDDAVIIVEMIRELTGGENDG